MNFSRLSRVNMALSPFKSVQEKVVVNGGAVTFDMMLPRLETIAKNSQLKIFGQHESWVPVVVKLDGWPDEQFGKEVFIRIGAQGIGCTLTCHGCDAADLPGYNLDVNEMVFQAVEVLRRVDLSKTEHLTIAFMGTGESGYNLQVADAISALDFLLGQGQTRFIVSATGGLKFLELVSKLLLRAEAGVNVDLQLSLNYPRQTVRLRYLRDKLTTGDQPKKTLTVTQLADFVHLWYQHTGRKVILSCVLDEQFYVWDSKDYFALAESFCPHECMIKLSVEGKKKRDCDAEITKRRGILEEMGYVVFVYDPVGNEIGAGCASHEITEA